jgi:stalled ribosome rescue protein Dom34
MPALPTLTLLGAVGLNSLFPHSNEDLWYPLCELANDDKVQISESKKDDSAGRHQPKSKSYLYMHLFRYNQPF